MMKSPVLKRLLNAPLLAIAVVVVLVDDVFRAVVVPAVQALARLAPIKRLEAAIAALPAPVILLLFLIPVAILEPFKLYALYLFSQGKLISGTMTFVVAKVVGLGLAERLFAVGRDKLLSIRWFAWCFRRTIAIRDYVHGWLVTTKVWQQALVVVRMVRETVKQGREALRKFAAAGQGGRFAAARRRVRRYWAT
ncbi:hypothetical protein [Microvirga terricola]|uniref:ABC transmembrane type-1 domain-containing protein n=1 Tax=Microvirga terricola TaxID=2719797 RepID=A0ABX0V8W0_9HYPH|nr:hypothetical protein [Microvirga terricola]NIX76283.1 hypothetical protein [Microvirga terricola]